MPQSNFARIVRPERPVDSNVAPPGLAATFSHSLDPKRTLGAHVKAYAADAYLAMRGPKPGSLTTSLINRCTAGVSAWDVFWQAALNLTALVKSYREIVVT